MVVVSRCARRYARQFLQLAFSVSSTEHVRPMESKPSRIVWGLRIFLFMAFLPASRAALIAYEGADYALTSSIAGLTGGTGWKGGWNGDTRVGAGSLAINGVSTSSNRFVTSGNGAGSARISRFDNAQMQFTKSIPPGTKMRFYRVINH